MSTLTLPFETWRHIFHHLPSEALTQLLLVSRGWRDVVNGTPELWTSISIRHPHQFTNPTGLSDRLNKSGHCLLNVFITVPADVAQPTLQPTLRLLYHHVNRFRVLHIDVPASNVADYILTYIAMSMTSPSRGNPAPHLEELRIVILDDMEPASIPPGYLENGFDPAPCLTRLVLAASRIPPPSSKLLSTITTLSIIESPEDQPPVVEQVLDAIAATRFLDSFHYSGVHVHSYQHTANIAYNRFIQVPLLLTADITVPGCGLDILRCFDAPHLTSVRLNGAREGDDEDSDGEEEWVDGDVVQFSVPLMRLPHHAPHIRSLDLNSIHYMLPETFTWLLHQADFVQLEQLRVADSPITDAALQHAGAPCPHLRRLELRDCAAITGGALMRYISRGEPNWPKDFQLLISGCPGVSDRDLERISQLVGVNKD